MKSEPKSLIICYLHSRQQRTPVYQSPMRTEKVKRCNDRLNCQKELVQDMLQFLVVLEDIFNKMC